LRPPARSSASSRLLSPELCCISSPSDVRGRRKAGCRLAPAVHCAKACATRAAQRHTGEAGNNPAFPAQWFDDLCRVLPGERCTIAPVALRMADARTRSGSTHHHKTWRTGPGRQDDTVLPYADSTGRVRDGRSLTVARPAISVAPMQSASTTAHPTFVTIAIRPSNRGEVAHDYDRSELRQRRMFCRGWIDPALGVSRTRQRKTW
jgi:hypothetical protein